MRIALLLAAPVVLAATALGLALALGGPTAPPPLDSIAAPFRSVDWSDLPPALSFTARDGQRLAYRAYAPAGGAARATVVLVHGSSARSESVHPLARGLARAGYAVVVPDVRGHGASGPKGRASYVGQLEDDLEDLLRAAAPGSPRILAGFSSGGGFALRFAAGARQGLFDRYVLLSPFLGASAPTYRAGPWVGIGVPRIVALSLLNRVGFSALNDLTVTAFAISPAERERLTPSYSYALAASFQPHRDWRADMRAARQPMAVVAGAEDELFRADRFAEAFAAAGRPVPVTIVPGVGHIGLTLSEAGVAAVVKAVGPDVAVGAAAR